MRGMTAFLCFFVLWGATIALAIDLDSKRVAATEACSND